MKFFIKYLRLLRCDRSCGCGKKSQPPPFPNPDCDFIRLCTARNEKYFVGEKLFFTPFSFSKKMFLMKFSLCQTGNFFFNLCLAPPQPPNQGRTFSTLHVCLFIGSFWRKNLLFWHSETMENYIQNFSLLSLPKFASPKQCKITTKNLPYFSYQKINVWKGGLHQIRAENFSSNFIYFPYQKSRISYGMSSSFLWTLRLNSSISWFLP